MSESSTDHPISLNLEQRYANEQAVGELMECCAPHQRLLLRILAVADRHDLPAAPPIAGLAQELPSLARRDALSLVEEIAKGTDPVDALEEVPGLLPPSSVLALRLARDNDALPALYSAVLSYHPGNQLEISANEDHPFSIFWRLGVRGFAIAAIISFMMLKIVPEFWKMMEYFGVELPSTFLLFMSMSDRVAKFWFLFPLAIICMIPFCIPSFRSYLRRFNPHTWRQPLLSGSTRRKRILALLTQSDASVGLCSAMIDDSPPLKQLFKRLPQACERIDDGEGTWSAMQGEGLISIRDAEALEQATTGQTRAWLLRWSANNGQIKQTSRAVFWSRILAGAGNIVLALFVALACVAVFQTLLAIMESLY